MGKHSREENINNKSNNSGVKKNKRSIHINGFGKFVLIVILLSAIVSAYFAPKIQKTIDALGGGKQGVLAMMLGHNEDTLKNLDKVYITLIGESGTDDYKLSDTLMILSYDPKTQSAAIMSIPRDTYVGSSKSSTSAMFKINARYQNGNKIDVLMNDLKEITGLDLKYYIRIDTKALVKLVDLVGGVEFNVPIDMKYDDNTQKLHINLKKGQQLINGEKAEQLLRFRHSNNGSTYSTEYGQEDLGRMRTQREFITAALSKMLKPGNITKINEVINIGYEYLDTNIDMDKMIDYVPYAVNYDVSNLRTEVLPGTPVQRDGLWIYTYNIRKTQEVVKDLFLDDEPQNEDTNS